MKLLHEDAESYHLLMPNGKKLSVKKDGLSKEAHSQVQHLNGGGYATTTPKQDVDNKQVIQQLIQDNRNDTPGYDAVDQAERGASQLNIVADPDKLQNRAFGGDVMGHQTRHNPNPKLAQVPEKDRYPSNILKMDEGGTAPTIHNHYYMNPPPTPSNYVQVAPPSPSPDGQAIGGDQTPPSVGANTGVQPVAAPTTPQDPSQDLIGQAQTASNEENRAITGIGKAQAQESGETAKALDENQQHLQDISQSMEKYGQQYHQAWDSIANNTDPTIDPKHYWNEKSTGGKIAAAIGFLISGAGLGVSGHPELAGKVIQDAVNRDTDSQKATFQNKDNLLRQYSEMYKSTNLGEDALRLQYGAQTENLIKRAAAQAGTPIAQQQAQLAIAKNRQALVGNMSNLAQGQATVDIANLKRQMINPQQSELKNAAVAKPLIDYDKLSKLQMTGLMPQPDVEAATKEASSFTEAEKLRQDMEQSAQHLGHQILHGAFSPNDRKSAINAFAGRIAKVGEGRFNLEESKLQAEALLPGKTDFPDTVKNKTQRRQAFFDTLAQTPTLDRYQLKNTTNSTPIQYKDGIPYKKVPGGWQRAQ